LFEAVKRALKFADVIGLRGWKARGAFHKNFFMEIAVEKSIVHIELFLKPILRGG